MCQAIERVRPAYVLTAVALMTAFASEEPADEYWLTHFKVAVAASMKAAEKGIAAYAQR